MHPKLFEGHQFSDTFGKDFNLPLDSRVTEDFIVSFIKKQLKNQYAQSILDKATPVDSQITFSDGSTLLKILIEDNRLKALVFGSKNQSFYLPTVIIHIL